MQQYRENKNVRAKFLMNSDWNSALPFIMQSTGMEWNFVNVIYHRVNLIKLLIDDYIRFFTN